jgi:hypothetical protein
LFGFQWVQASSSWRGAEGEEMTMSPNWTPEEDQRLLDLVAAEATWPLIALNLGRSIQAVQERAQTLKRDGVVTGLKVKGK